MEIFDYSIESLVEVLDDGIAYEVLDFPELEKFVFRFRFYKTIEKRKQRHDKNEVKKAKNNYDDLKRLIHDIDIIPEICKNPEQIKSVLQRAISGYNEKYFFNEIYELQKRERVLPPEHMDGGINRVLKHLKEK
jgi:hypothetical protein